MYQLQRVSGTVQVGDVLAVHLVVNGSPMKYLLIEVEDVSSMIGEDLRITIAGHR